MTAPAAATLSLAPPLLEAEDLRVTTTGPTPTTIVDGLGLQVDRGECIGIVGESGSGKSLALRAAVGLLPAGTAASGSVRLDGEDLLTLSPADQHRIRGRRISLLLQDPFTMLHPLRTCGRQIADGLLAATDSPTTAGSWRGRRRAHRADREAEVARRLAEVGLDPQVAHRYPFQLSGGMRQRVAIAAALAADPELLIADEPTTALDAVNRRAVLDLLQGLRCSRRMGLVLITHDLRVAFSSCDRVYVMYAGSILEHGPATQVQAAPRHPYTAGLLASEPSLERCFSELPTMPGSVPPPGARTDGCPFAVRCAHAAPQCRTTPLRLMPAAEPSPGAGPHLSACLRLAEIGDDLAVLRIPADPPASADPRAAVPTSSLRITAVTKSFRTPTGEQRVLDRVSLEVPQGSVTALVGESGSGKTTLARIAIGLETYEEGEVEVEGLALAPHRLPGTAQRRRLAQRAQIVFQDPYSSLNPLRTVGAALREALTAAPADRGAPTDIPGLLAQVGLPAAYAGRRPAALSGGERQRVAIARALAVRPRLLICDESVSALDVSVQAQILNLFAELRRRHGFSVLFITHDLAVARQIADHVHVLHRGQVVESGPTDRILGDPRDAYTRRLLAALPLTG
ncbi:dipeptide ABC transporter ATP-binding protein [Streptomyces sp. NPDC058107]|uniref:dipeptide ABC transporter ATP-binding protein n=1 Tax=Streptomyces sp. NPDC058107 TaxID=3346343 RepID=UPI0036EFDC79